MILIALGLDINLIIADEAYHDNGGAVFAQSGAHMATLLLELAGTRKAKKTIQKQMLLPFAA